MPLVDKDASLLLVIDCQEGFYPPGRTDVDRSRFDAFIDRVAWITGVARALSVPTVVTEEDPGQNGPTSPRVLEQLAVDSPVHPKPIFGACDNPPILAAIIATGRGTVVIAGMETDVCVAHSALGLLECGHRVVAVRDALFSPGEAHGHGIARLTANGVELVSAKELYYDWVRTLANARAFRRSNPALADPPGFSL